MCGTTQHEAWWQIQFDQKESAIKWVAKHASKNVMTRSQVPQAKVATSYYTMEFGE
jgi:hypothetical protein